MPIHDGSLRREMTCAGLFPPSLVDFFAWFSDTFAHRTGFLGFQRNPGVFAFLRTQIGWHHRWSNDLQKATEDLRGEEEAAGQEVERLLAKTRRPTTDKNNTS